MLDLVDTIQVFPHDKIIHINKIIVVHSSYTINIARDWNEDSHWILQLIDEIKYAHSVNAFGIVIHMGKSLDLTKKHALNNMYSCLLYINKETENLNVQIILETPSGQGTEMCSQLEDFAYFFKKFIRHPNKKISDRFKVCVDTCHIFAAGYNIKQESIFYSYMEAFEELIGTHYIGLIHFNDSKGELCSNVDRHANIGKGNIGIESMKHIYKKLRTLGVPIILETPYEYIHHDIQILIEID